MAFKKEYRLKLDPLGKPIMKGRANCFEVIEYKVAKLPKSSEEMTELDHNRLEAAQAKRIKRWHRNIGLAYRLVHR